MKRAILFLLFATTLSAPLHAAVECSVQGAPVLDFGTVDPFTGGAVTSQVTLNWSCSRGWFESQQNTICIHLANDSSNNQLPRYLDAISGQPPAIPFNVYTSPAHATAIGQPGTTTNAGVGINVDMPWFTFNTSGTVTLYGQLPRPLPATTRAETHQTLMTGSQVRVRTGGLNQSCNSGAGATTGTYTLTARATIPDQCQVSATDLDFGTRNTPLTQADSESTVSVRCSNSTDFLVGLSNGSHGQRNLSNGSYLVSYELYRDAGRSLRWGNSAGERQSGTGQGPGTGLSFTVFGRVFADANAEVGSYRDTVTVEVTF